MRLLRARGSTPATILTSSPLKAPILDTCAPIGPDQRLHGHPPQKHVQTSDPYGKLAICALRGLFAEGVSGALRHALLGLLSQERASGYELARRFERTLWRDAWHAQYSQIRPELDQMAIDGLITVVATGARRRRTYSITRDGQAELQRWLLNPPERFVARSEFVLRLFLLPTLDPADARTLLAPIVDATAQELATRRAAVATAGTSAGAGAPLSFDRLAAEFSLRSVEALHEWARWVLTELDR